MKKMANLWEKKINGGSEKLYNLPETTEPMEAKEFEPFARLGHLRSLT